jgi:hypothetical protein
MTTSLITSVYEAVNALRHDLLDEDGPRISTMRNYRFAILVYDPKQEFSLRQHIQSLTHDLQARGWNVGQIYLNQLLLKRLKQEEERVIESISQREQSLYRRNPERALNHLKEKIAPYVEGPEGIARDIISEIDQFVENHPVEADRTVIFLRRAGALYPFLRSSALLKHLDGKTRNLPVVLLYPGERKDTQSLSFMGELPGDRDYRPRIYG